MHETLKEWESLVQTTTTRGLSQLKSWSTMARKATGGRSSVPGSPSPSIFSHIIFTPTKFKGKERESLGTRLERFMGYMHLQNSRYTSTCSLPGSIFLKPQTKDRAKSLKVKRRQRLVKHSCLYPRL